MPRKSSFPPIVDADTRVLVCGSLPGDASLKAARYYAHPQNQFWRLMAAVVDVDLPALPYEDRLAALSAAGIGLWDVVASARRDGSSDAAIRDITGNDIAALAATLPHLRAIAFNGGTAVAQGRRQLGTAAGRYAIVALPSSSPLHTVGFAAKLPAWMALRQHLPDRHSREGGNDDREGEPPPGADVATGPVRFDDADIQRLPGPAEGGTRETPEEI